MEVFTIQEPIQIIIIIIIIAIMAIGQALAKVEASRKYQ